MEYNSNNLTPTGLAHKLIHELRELGDLLSTTVQKLIIKKFCDYILEHRSSIEAATHLLPLEAALVVIQVREHEAFYHEINVLHERIDTLERKNKELEKMLGEKV
jgi:hypothetical protein